MSGNLIQFSQNICKLNKEKKFSDTLKFFKENKTAFTKEQIRENDFLVSAMLNALQKTNYIDSAFKFLDVYNITIDENTKERVLVSYGWILYFKFKSENKHNESNQNETEIFDEDENVLVEENYNYAKSEIIQKTETYIPLIIKINNNFAYSIFSKLFTSVLKIEKRKPKPDWKFINDFCSLVTPDILKTDCRTIEIELKGKTKTMELASDKESWFAYKSKALMKLGRFNECYEISKAALETFNKFHYSNDVWFARRIALAKKSSGNLKEAIIELNEVLKRKKEWFIQKEIADLYKESGDVDNAFNYAIQAVNNFGSLEYKVDLLFLLGELLKKKEENDLAFNHYSLSRLIRLKANWSIPSKLSLELKQFDKETIPIEKLRELERELRKYWDSFKFYEHDTRDKKYSNNQLVKGKIDKILHNNEKGADGFIKYENNKSIYFRTNSTDIINTKIKVGANVEFKILSGAYDKRERAVIITII